MTIRHAGVHKFGRNATVATSDEPIVDENAQANAFPAAAAATNIISTSDADNGATATGALTVKVEGINDAGEYITEVATMDGNTQAVLSSEFRIVLRLKVLTAGSGGVNAGRIDVRHSTTVIASIKVASGQSEIAAWYFADSGLGGEVVQLDLGTEAISTKTVTFHLVLIRGGVLREQFHSLLNTDLPTLQMAFAVPMQFEAGDLIYVTGKGSTGTTAVFARIHVRNR